MITDKNMVSNECLFNENKTHRYMLSRQWSKKKKAMIITKCPGLADGIFCDLTTNIITNNLYNLGYGGFCAVNLFSAINCEDKVLYDKQTDEILIKCANACDDIIIAWGSTAGAVQALKEREKDVLVLLASFQSKLYILSSSNKSINMQSTHPLSVSVRRKFELVAYKYNLNECCEKKPVNKLQK